MPPHSFGKGGDQSEMGGRRIGGYEDGAPWVFTGRALYQLHLVKAEVAQRFIPPELKLVQAFGYTLGGLYLARYSNSPAGVFDELVVIAGIVWNPPTSCAWAAKVLVNSEVACDHGRKEVGLPSQFAKFSQTSSLMLKKKSAWRNVASKFESLWPWLNAKRQPSPSKEEFCGVGFDIRVTEGPLSPLCHIALPQNTIIQNEVPCTWKGPSIKMSLPSFSGKTGLQPQLLKYSCDLRCRIRVVPPAVVTTDVAPTESEPNNELGRREIDTNVGIQAILTSKPIFAMRFDDMFMGVEAPVVVASSKTAVGSAGFLQPAFATRK